MSTYCIIRTKHITNSRTIKSEKVHDSIRKIVQFGSLSIQTHKLTAHSKHIFIPQLVDTGYVNVNNVSDREELARLEIRWVGVPCTST